MPKESQVAGNRDETVAFDIEAVMQMIPHRYPFLMIDKVVDVVIGKSATGIKNVTAGEPYFEGHFPVKRVMPGVLIIEAMAQTAAVLVAHTLALDSEDRMVYFMTIDGARFRKPVLPGDTLELHVSKERQRGAVWKFTGRAKVDGKLVAEATFAAMIADAE